MLQDFPKNYVYWHLHPDHRIFAVAPKKIDSLLQNSAFIARLAFFVPFPSPSKKSNRSLRVIFPSNTQTQKSNVCTFRYQQRTNPWSIHREKFCLRIDLAKFRWACVNFIFVKKSNFVYLCLGFSVNPKFVFFFNKVLKIQNNFSHELFMLKKKIWNNRNIPTN